MYLIDFETTIENGIIRIPEIYKYSTGKKVRVILIEEAITEKECKKKELLKLAGTLKLRETPLDFQKRIRDEWE